MGIRDRRLQVATDVSVIGYSTILPFYSDYLPLGALAQIAVGEPLGMEIVVTEAFSDQPTRYVRFAAASTSDTGFANFAVLAATEATPGAATVFPKGQRFVLALPNLYGATRITAYLLAVMQITADGAGDWSSGKVSMRFGPLRSFETVPHIPYTSGFEVKP